MLLINCPFCGLRDEVEFRYGGQSHVVRPEHPDQVSDAIWAAYLFTRANPKGPGAERWLHAGGCRQWFNINRHTVTHDIIEVYSMGDAAPSSNTGVA